MPANLQKYVAATLYNCSGVMCSQLLLCHLAVSLLTAPAQPAMASFLHAERVILGAATLATPGASMGPGVMVFILSCRLWRLSARPSDPAHSLSPIKFITIEAAASL